jgi:Protein of unknown function (DUF664)
MSSALNPTTTSISSERRDLLESLTMHRALLRRTAEGLDDAQASERSTPSELTIGGIIAETAQHAGHADIIREAIDGQKSMG